MLVKCVGVLGRGHYYAPHTIKWGKRKGGKTGFASV